MKSINNLHDTPAGSMIIADDIVEFHASRILLLLLICGSKERKTKLIKLNGLTKLAKLDFFIRYPVFFEQAANYLNEKVVQENPTIESKMIRFFYGPWDNRYYQVLPYLEARNLIKIEKEVGHKNYLFYLTEEGINTALLIKDDPDYAQLIERIKQVKTVLGHKSGSKLKRLVYDLFQEEVKDKKLGELIEP